MSTISLSHAERCRKLVATVNNLSNMEKEELFKILHKNDVNYTRNNNGVFINLTWVNNEILEDLETYVQFCTNSHIVLHKYESICDLLNSSLTKKTITSRHQPPTVIPAHAPGLNHENPNPNPTHSVNSSSSVRYTMYKKRFAKQSTLDHGESDLRSEEYVYS